MVPYRFPSQFHLFQFLLIFLQLCLPSFSAHRRVLLQKNVGKVPSCPLDFSVLREILQANSQPDLDVATQCQYTLQGLRLVRSVYLRRTNLFLPSLDFAESCWVAYQTVVDQFIPDFDIRKKCGFQTDWISEGCMNITTRAEFEGKVTKSALDNVVSACNRSSLDSSSCATCTTILSNLHATYLTGPSIGNVSTCLSYPSIYAAAFVNQNGLTDKATVRCLFSLSFSSPNSKKGKSKTVVISVVVIACCTVLLLCLSGYLFFKRKHGKLRKKRKIARTDTSLTSGLDSISGNTSLVKYTFDEVRQATNNFSRVNIIGRGGYGNVYKGMLPDGTEVAFKRFKNCSVAGDASFAHEVEVIASVRHVNLVALRGYCTATTPLEGHQRIIVCDLMTNGSLHDHLFGMMERKLSWPIRQKIALGTARGLAYLHYGVQPAIIHRDIKDSNILLDDRFEPKLADFGLAKFTPEGITHLSTRVAGTIGYVAPEYVLYGQLSERSDVYSFGVVLLELLSGKKALTSLNDGQPTLVTDWAWSLVKIGKALSVIDEGVPDLGLPEVMEKYVLLAVLCSHPQLYARPTMDQVVKIMETDLPVPSIPERPIPIIADIDDIERSVSSSGSGQLSTSVGYQTYTFENDHSSISREEGANSGGGR